jgi:hypothetical protein
MHTIALVLFKLTLWEIVSDIPHDGPALVIYMMLALFGAGIWYGSRGKAAPEAGNAGGAGDGI